MKNVLFATTALVAFAGAAAAEVGFSGDIEIGYYDDGTIALTNGFYAEGGLDLTGSMDFDYGVSVEVTYGADLYTGGANLLWDAFPTVVITTEWVTLTAGEVESAGVDHFSDIDGMTIDSSYVGEGPDGIPGNLDDVTFVDATPTGFFEENGEFIIRADATFGDISVSVSGVAVNMSSGGAVNNLSVGASGSFGSVSFGVGYDDTSGVMGISGGTTFGGFDVDVAYMADGTDSSIGVAVGTTISSIDVGGYYAMNTAGPLGLGAGADAYGLDLSTTFGQVTVAAYYDATVAAGTGVDTVLATSNFGVDIEYAVSEAVTVFAGYDDADSYYVGAIMDIADGAAVGFSYADDTVLATEFGPEDFAAGLKVWFSAEF